MNEHDNISELVKLTPPVGVSTLSVLGVPLSDLVYIFTILYIIIQMVCTIYRTYKTTKE